MRSTGADAPFPSVSDAEFQRRYALIWDAMRARRLDALVAYGDASGSGANLANCFYLTGFKDPLFSYAVVVPGSEPVLLISNPLYLPHAQTMARVGTVDAIGWEPGTRLGELIWALGAASGRIGMVGVRGIQKTTLPHEHMQALASSAPHAEWEDATDLLQGIRRIKSDEEIGMLRKGAALTDETVRVLQREARAGMTESELAGIVLSAALRGGGVQQTLFIGSTSMADPDLVFPRQSPSHRRVHAGDIVLTELSTEHAGYAGQIHRPLVIGQDPSSEYEELFDIAHETYSRVVDALSPGNTDEHVRSAAGPILTQARMWTMDTLVHGWGLSIEAPRLDVTGRSVIRRPQEPIIFEPGMTMVVQPHVLSPDKRRGLQLGSLVVITNDGPEAIQHYPMEFLTVPLPD